MPLTLQHRVWPARRASQPGRRNGSPKGLTAAWLTALALALALAFSHGVSAASEPQSSGTVPSKVWRFAQRWVAEHDTDGDGRLSEAEWQPLEGSLQEADLDQDAVVTVEELAQHIADFGAHRKIRLMPAGGSGVVPLPSLLPPGVAAEAQTASLSAADGAGPASEDAALENGWSQGDLAGEPGVRKYYIPPSRLPPGLPDWFQKADRDGDGQLTFAEYARLGSPSADKEFAKYDRNRDGLVTPSEVVGGGNRVRRPAQPQPATPEKKPPETAPEAKDAAEEKAAAEDSAEAADEGTAVEERAAVEEPSAARATSGEPAGASGRAASDDSDRDAYSRRRQRSR